MITDLTIFTISIWPDYTNLHRHQITSSNVWTCTVISLITGAIMLHCRCWRTGTGT